MHFRLIWKNAFRSKRRTLLTIFSVAVSLLLLCTMLCYLSSNDLILERAGGTSRVVVRHATSLTFNLPESYKAKLEAVPHVKIVHPSSWFGGMIENRDDLFFSNLASDHLTMATMWDDYRFSPGAMEAIAAEPRGAIIGERLLAKMEKELGWKLGKTVSLTSPIYQITLEMVLVGTCDGPDENLLLFRWDYLENARGKPGEVGTYWLKVDSTENVAGVCRDVDRMFANSEFETKTETEKAFQEGFMSMMGNIKDLLVNIGLAVVATILLVAINTMAMAARERVTEHAIMRTLGFSRLRIAGLFVGESVLISLLAGVIGIGFAVLMFTPGKFDLGGFAPYFHMTGKTTGIAFAVAGIVGLIAGILPAIGASRRTIVDGLRRLD